MRICLDYVRNSDLHKKPGHMNIGISCAPVRPKVNIRYQRVEPEVQRRLAL